jgi:hypothetical protein
MPSRKKAKGKARKAAKEAKEEEDRAVVNVAAGQRQERSLATQLQRLVISAKTKCFHGRHPLSAGETKICRDFIAAFLTVLHSEANVGLAFALAQEATIDEYAEVYDSKLDGVISILLFTGTECILGGHNHISTNPHKTAQTFASLVGYFEDYMAVCSSTAEAISKTTKIIELGSADDHTLVSFYRKRITCSCLDEKYEEVKSVKKMGRCFNPNCSHPGGMVERSKMLSCARCGYANYCSVECQKAIWKAHRVHCDEVVKWKAAFD